MRVAIALVTAILLLAPALPPAREVAITIDDLPRGGDGGGLTLDAVRDMTARLMRPFSAGKVPVIGFVNEGRVRDIGHDGLRAVLDQWLDAGAELGNHTYSHPDINQVPLDVYTGDIVKGETVLREALTARGKTLRYYRHPFLHAGPTPELKEGLQRFLDARGYRVAPVTIDNSDYLFAALYTRAEYRDRVRREYVPYMESVVEFFERRAVEVIGREFPQTLLLHANELNADLMPEVLDMFRRRGYTFVTLERALGDDAYQSADEYVGPSGFSWIHRWSMTKNMPRKGEPDPPQWVLDARAGR